jgi:hypothetical protein
VLTTCHPLSVKVGTSIADKRQSLGLIVRSWTLATKFSEQRVGGGVQYALVGAIIPYLLTEVALGTGGGHLESMD